MRRAVAVAKAGLARACDHGAAAQVGIAAAYDECDEEGDTGGRARVSAEVDDEADEGGDAPPSSVAGASPRSSLHAAAKKVAIMSGVVTRLTTSKPDDVGSARMEKSRSFSARISRKAFDTIAELSEEVGGGTL